LKIIDKKDLEIYVDDVFVAKITVNDYQYFVQSPEKVGYPSYASEYKSHMKFYAFSGDLRTAVNGIIDMMKYRINKNPNYLPHILQNQTVD
jgi:hypothetical protein